jgi:sugar phosphate isomerase/epimerase
MKASFCMMGFGYTREIAERCIALCGRLGYDAIELWKQYLDTADLDWTRAMCERHGLEILQLCPYFDFSTSRETCDASRREAERFVGYARKLGAKWIRTYTLNTPSADATDEQWERSVDALKQICELGAVHGIAFPLETHQVLHHGPTLTDTSASTLRLLALVDRPNLHVALQTPLVGETPEESAERLGHVTVQVQAHNWTNASPTRWGDLTFLDAGDLDFANYIRILKSKGFDGYVSIDHPNHHPWEETAAHEIAYLRRLFGDLNV